MERDFCSGRGKEIGLGFFHHMDSQAVEEITREAAQPPSLEVKTSLDNQINLV